MVENKYKSKVTYSLRKSHSHTLMDVDLQIRK